MKLDEHPARFTADGATPMMPPGIRIAVDGQGKDERFVIVEFPELEGITLLTLPEG